MIVLGKIKIKFQLLKAQLLLGFLVICIACDSNRISTNITGQTMGTTYSIKIISQELSLNQIILKEGIDSVLSKINMQMSTWDHNSEISRINRDHTKEPILLSPELQEVMSSAISISKKSNGVFDITIYELMSLWGFGPEPKKIDPTNKEIKKVLENTGWKKINLVKNYLIREKKNLKFDLNAIAKGYGVDKVFQYLQSRGYNNIFVEIGGEVRCSGINLNNQSWRLGIEVPLVGGSINTQIAGIISLSDKAMATSGNYRNFVDIGGEIIGHTVNPILGRPVKTNVLSVTVISSSCMIADSWATTLMVLDYKNGKKLIEKENDLNVVWVIEMEDRSRRISSTNGISIENAIYDSII